MSRFIGIDFGTTNSVMAVVEGGEPTIIPTTLGGRLMPSVVAVNPKTGERLVGKAAKTQAVINPENTITSIKRFIGRKFTDPEVQRALKVVPYRVSAAPNGDVRISMGGRDYSPQEITAMLLQTLKKDAEAYLGDQVSEVVITVPAYFNDIQRSAIRDAGRIAGFEVVRMINAPTAAALAYDLSEKRNIRVAVYDLGGGKFDVSLLEIGDGVYEVRSTNGDSYLGGDNFDEVLLNRLANDFQRQNSVDLRQDRLALQRLREAVEQARITLSSAYSADINLPYISAIANQPLHLNTTLTRAQLEAETQALIERTIEPCKRALKDAGLTVDELDTVLLVGGTTRMPAVQTAVKQFFRRSPSLNINPEEAGALGAAIQAAVYGGDIKDVLLLDVLPMTLSVETLGGIATPMIERNTTIPTRKAQVFSTAADNQTQVEIHIVQGERPMATDNRSLGRFILDGIPPAPRGVPQIEVHFDVDANGILNVSAQDKATKREQKISITAASGLSEREIQRMIVEARDHSNSDQARRKLTEAHLQAETTLYNAEKSLRDYGNLIKPERHAKLQEAIAELGAINKTDDPEKIAAAVAILQVLLQSIGSDMYATERPKESSQQDATDQAPVKDTPKTTPPPASKAPSPDKVPTPLKVFISYSSRNLELARELANEVSSLKHHVWFDQELTGGQQWWNEILRNIRECDLFVYAVTEEALDSYPCRLERNYAHDLNKRVLPIQLTDVNIQLLSVRDASIQFVNFRASNAVRTVELQRAFDNLPSARPMPAPLPVEPPVPISPINRLRDQLEKPELTRDEQFQILNELELLLDKRATHEGALRLLRIMHDRDDLLAAADRKIRRLLDIQPPLT